jgi:hypothetical protein
MASSGSGSSESASDDRTIKRGVRAQSILWIGALAWAFVVVAAFVGIRVAGSNTFARVHHLLGS